MPGLGENVRDLLIASSRRTGFTSNRIGTDRLKPELGNAQERSLATIRTKACVSTCGEIITLFLRALLMHVLGRGSVQSVR